MANNFVLFIYFDIIIIFYVNKFRTLADDDSTCAIVKSPKMVNCSHRKLPSVPNYFADAGDITVIDFSSATIGLDEPFNATTFAKYPKLVNLIMRSAILFTNCSNNRSCPPKVIPPDVFLPLKVLENVDFSYSNVVLNVSLKWPATMRIIHLDFLKIIQIPSMANLEELEDFSANNGSIRLFPTFNKEAGINRIELSNNPLDEVNVKDIAPFCELKYLGIRVRKDGNFSKKQKFCPCTRLQKWVKRVGISGAELLICDNDGGKLKEKSCKEDMTFKEEDKIYNECLSKLSGSSFWELLVMALIFALLFPVLYFANEFYNNHYAKKKDTAAVAETKRDESENKSDNDGSVSEADRGDSISFVSEEEG